MWPLISEFHSFWRARTSLLQFLSSASIAEARQAGFASLLSPDGAGNYSSRSSDADDKGSDNDGISGSDYSGGSDRHGDRDGGDHSDDGGSGCC